MSGPDKDLRRSLTYFKHDKEKKKKVSWRAFEWNGKAVAAKVAAAAEIGVEKTMADCVHDARADHPAFPPASEPYERYANRTGFETGAIRSNGATFDGRRAFGATGSAYTEYALFLEIGTSVPRVQRQRNVMDITRWRHGCSHAPYPGP